ncbi:MAG: LysM peptidoglycan-binding domain-containing protein [Chloroflexi bacterium]|nr:MAG: LysM peptidoglycan-binding domain-containing protein [Chloroflexota bacterium]
MKRRNLLIGCTTVLVLLALVLAAGFLWFRYRSTADVPQQAQAAPPIFVDILSPSSGLTLRSGNGLPVVAQVWSLEPLVSVELWQDGQLYSAQDSQGTTSPLQLSWTWQAAAPGVHTLTVHAQDVEDQTAQSHTLIVNVSATGIQQVQVVEGETLETISAQMGIPLQDLVVTNPGLEPQQPLGDGHPVFVPPVDSGPGAPGPQLYPQALGGIDVLIQWTFTPKEPVDQLYCYQSIGDGVWQRVPQEPFSFMPGLEWLQTLILKDQETTLSLMLDCWGWQAGILKYLGQGQTNVDLKQLPVEISISGNGFDVSGLPQMKPLVGPPPGGDAEVPAPFALREAASVSECADHFGNVWAALVCNELMNAWVKQYYMLVWEWQPQFCIPGSDCKWINDIDGYYVYEVDPETSQLISPHNVPNPSQKALAVSLPWGARCYAIKAYAENPQIGHVDSKAYGFCPGGQNDLAPQKLILTPEDWLSTQVDRIDVGGCSNYGTANIMEPQGTQIVAGVFSLNTFGCWRQDDTTAGVKFNMPDLISGAVIQQATLRFSEVQLDYQIATDVATNEKPQCVTRLNLAAHDWTALSSAHYITGKNYLLGKAYNTPYKSGFSVLPGGKLGMDVTGAVLKWIKDPSTNHGFILVSAWSDLYNANILKPGADNTVCYSRMDQVELEILFFVPPGN